MALLPKPYPDEAIGSVIARAAWHYGLPLKRLLTSLFRKTTSGSSLLMGTGFYELAQAASTDPEELMMAHTVFPYVTAFMPPQMKAQLKSKALNPRPGEDCLSSLTKNVSHGVPFRRICPACVADEMYRYGETYWHRQHLLPANLVCLIHGVTLADTAIPLRGGAQSRNTLLPHMTTGSKVPKGIPSAQHLRLASMSAHALNEGADFTQQLQNYRTLAVDLGYILPRGQVASVAFSEQLQNFYGPELLAQAGCPLSACIAWPALMLRPNGTVPFATPKHVLLQVFMELGSGPIYAVNSTYKRPGKKTTDFGRLDVHLARGIKDAIAKAKAGNRRLTVKELLNTAGSWGTFKHQRNKLPVTKRLIEEFRTSDQSERQLGGREYWRKRLPKRFPS